MSRARKRRLANLRRGEFAEVESPRTATAAECRNSDDRDGFAEGGDDPRVGASLGGRTDAAIAQRIGLGGKDLYRQARSLWRMARQGDTRARNAVAQLDAGTKTIHAAYKDLRRRDRFSADFRPTPYDVWPFRHDRAFGIPHPGSIPPAIVAHTLHYFTSPGGLVVDPMAGGGTTLDVCQSMGRRCLAYDLAPSRPEIRRHDIRAGFPAEASGCDLIFCDPPYHTMLARAYVAGSVASAPLNAWIEFLHELTRHAFAVVRAGGYLALLLAPQTEKDLPAGYGYLDHAFFGYIAASRAGFLPERRISCPMDGGYVPQQVRRARVEGRMLGQVRDLLVVRKPLHIRESGAGAIPFLEPWLGDGSTSPGMMSHQEAMRCIPDVGTMGRSNESLRCHNGICHFCRGDDERTLASARVARSRTRVGSTTPGTIQSPSMGSPQASSYTLPRTKGLDSVGLRRTSGSGRAATAWATSSSTLSGPSCSST